MRSRLKPLASLSVLLMAVAVFTSCQSTDHGSSGAAYYDSGLNDPWYYGDYYDDIDVIVTPPDERPPEPVKPTHPIVLPPASRPIPTPMPSIPRMPMPRAR